MQSENLKKTIYAAILGAGTVGTGVYKLCQEMKSECKKCVKEKRGH